MPPTQTMHGLAFEPPPQKADTISSPDEGSPGMPIGLTIHRQHASMPNPNLMRPDYPDEGAAGMRPSIVSHNIKSDAIARTRTGRGQGGVHRTTEGGGGWASTAQPKEGGSLAQPKEEGGSLAQPKAGKHKAAFIGQLLQLW